MRSHSKSILFLCVFALGVLLFPHAEAATVQDQINDTNKKIEALQAEIKQYESSLNQTSSKAKSLQNELASLTTTRKKLEAQLKLTTANLDKTAASIKQIAGQIDDTQEKIDLQKKYLRGTLRDMAIEDNTSLAQTFLATKSLSEVSDYLVATEKVSKELDQGITNLMDSEAKLSNQKTSAETKKNELAKLKTNLAGQTQVMAQTADLKNKLLSDTKGEQANYQKILDEKKKLMEQFEKELYDYQANLGIKVNLSALPSAKKGILSWPLDKIIITQNFGKTSFSGRLYASGTHNGTDFGASDGTPVKAALSGVVRATGNTDLKKNCLSYGKWILVDHPNGLSTLYAHLSVQSVKAGQSVATGDTIAFSGRTGYVTGPHLHLTVLVSKSTEVMVYPLDKAVNCGGVTIPIAPPTAFLDPMAYLPTL